MIFINWSKEKIIKDKKEKYLIYISCGYGILLATIRDGNRLEE